MSYKKNVSNFKTWGDARSFCDKYGLKVGISEVFETAEALLRAYNDGEGATEKKLCLCPKYFGDCEFCDNGKCDSPLI